MTDARLTASGLGMLHLTPPFLWEDPQITGQFGAVGQEIDTVDAALLAIRNGALPTLAEDPYLALWERLLSLPIQPAKTLAQRRTTVLTFLRRIDISQEALVWLERLREMVGPFVYTVHHQDGLKAFYRDRFNTTPLSSEWTFSAGTIDNLAIEGAAIHFKNTNETLIRQPFQNADEFGILHFMRGAADTGVPGVVLKWIDNENYLMVDYTGGKLRVRKKDAGVFTTLKEEAIATTASTDYWIKAKIVGNVVTAQLHAKDPARMIASLKSFTYTLETTNATKYGSGVKQRTGIRMASMPNDWTVLDFLTGQANTVVGNYTVQILLEVTEGGSSAKQVERLARDITPAKLKLEVTYGIGFLLGDETHGILGTSTL